MGIRHGSLVENHQSFTSAFLGQGSASLQISGWATRAFSAARERIQDDFPGGQRGWKLPGQNMGKNLWKIWEGMQECGGQMEVYIPGNSSVGYGFSNIFQLTMFARRRTIQSRWPKGLFEKVYT